MDDDLTKRLADDVDEAFEDLVRREQHAVFTIARRLGASPADAEDLAQDVFVRAYRALHTWDAGRRSELRVRPWLASITVNLVRNAARTRSRRPVVAATLDAVANHPGRERGSLADWDDTLASLPVDTRAAVVLHHVVGLDYDEIADALATPVGTVKARVHRGLSKLRMATAAKSGSEEAS